MSVARKWVFPILRIVIFAAIAAALVKIAFFANDGGDQAVGEFPTGGLVEPEVVVGYSTIANDIVLDGNVVPAPSSPVTTTMSGEVRSVSVKNGDTVKRGQEIAQIRAMLVGDDGMPAGTRWLVLKAPVGGVVSGLALFVGESVGAGQDVGKVTPTSFRVTATIPPTELYRLIDEPESATVTVTGGPAPFECADLAILAPSVDDSEGAGQTSMRCTVPDEVRVFAGLTAQVSIPGGLAENVLVVPMTAVLGAADTGIVYALLPDGTSEERPVVLGLNDGIFVEIREGLAEGDTILEFVPGAPAVDAGEGGFFPMPIEGDGVIIEDGVIVGEGG